MSTTRTRYINRTTAINKIQESKGRFFTVTWLTKGGSERTVNCNVKNDCITKLGYIRAYVPKVGYKSIDPRTITELSIAGNTYKIRK